MVSVTFGRLMIASLAIALSGCGSSSRPAASGRAPAAEPAVAVSIPVPPPAPRVARTAPAQLAAYLFDEAARLERQPTAAILGGKLDAGVAA